MPDDDRLRAGLQRLAADGAAPPPVLRDLARRRRNQRLARAVTVAAPLAVVALVAGLVVSASDEGPTPPASAPAQPSSSAPPATLDPSELLTISEVRADLPRSTERAPRSDVRSVVTGDTSLAMGLYREFAAQADGNLFFSPYSISMALAMLEPGAAGTSREQLQAALGVELDADRYHAARNTLAQELAASGRPQDYDGDGRIDARPLQLEVTNGLFGQDGFEIEEPYLERLAADYGAGLQTLDFQDDANTARGTINDWVSRHTRGRIPTLFGEDTITPDTLLVLANAIFFKAAWAAPFDEAATEEAPFTRVDGSQVEVQMMRRQSQTLYGEGDGWSAAMLAYDGDASMTVIVPDEGRFDEIERAMEDGLLEDLPPWYRPTSDPQWAQRALDLRMPRFSFGSAPGLRDALDGVGVTDIFDDARADLSGISRSERLVVAAAVHKATVAVDEEGTVAAAATGMSMVPTAGPPPPASLTVDRPFLVAVRHGPTGSLLFLGRVMDPTAT